MDSSLKGQSMNFRALSFAAALLAGSFSMAHASDADFKLKNKTGYQIDHVFVTAHGDSSWGSDILGRDAMADGEFASITFAHGTTCRFDIKVTYHDADVATWGNVDLCQYESISLFWDAQKQESRAVGE